MSISTDTPTSGFSGRIARFFGVLGADRELRHARRAEFNRVYDELACMSARELADIGLHRSEIGRVAREAAERV